MTWWRRVLAGAVLSVGLLAGGAGVAQAAVPSLAIVPNVPGAATPPPPDTGGGGGLVGDALSKALDAMCPRIQAPTPALPQLTPEQSKPGRYGEYGSAGLFWTTYDQSCFDVSRADTSFASGLNQTLNQTDDLVNDMQAFALDPERGTAFDAGLQDTASALGDFVFHPWMLIGIGIGGTVAVFAMWRGNDTEGAATTLVAIVATLGVLFFLTEHPTTVTDASDRVTVKVTRDVANAINDGTGSPVGGADQLQETYYRATSYQAWLQGMFCGDPAASAKYGPLFLDDQAFTSAEWTAARTDSATQAKLVQAKQASWLQHAAQLKQEFPAVFACWAGETNQRTGAMMKHAAVTVVGGMVVVVASGAVGVLRYMLRLGIILTIALGGLILASRKVTSGFLEIMVLGLLGPPIVAALSGAVLYGMAATLRVAPTQDWWTSIVSVALLGLAAWFLRQPLSRMLQGLGMVGTVGGAGRRMTRAGQRAVRQGLQPGQQRSSGAAAAAGGAVGGAIGTTVVNHFHVGGDSDGGAARRERGPASTDEAGSEPGGAAPATSTSSSSREDAASNPWARHGEQPPVVGDVPVVDIGEPSPFQTVNDTSRGADVAERAGSSAQRVEQGWESVKGNVSARLAAYEAKARAAGTPPTGVGVGASGDAGPRAARTATATYTPPPVVEDR